ncbi:MAG: hydroxyacylglutathione hydrolase [Parvibaculales bacterium]
MKQLEIDQFPCLEDNYGYLLHDPETGATATIDTPDAGVILQRLADKGWQLTHILNTHHHWDHAGGNLEIKEATGCEIIGPACESEKIPGIDRAVDQDDMIAFGNDYLEVINVGGHTLGHIAYFLRSQKTAFVGDALFAMGCGRLFEGTPAQMWASLSRLNRLPAETVICCAHEYTLANAAFALSVDPDNQALIERTEDVKARRAAGLPTVPTTLSLERATNPFLRVDDPAMRILLDMQNASQVDVFAEIRHRKDNFKG